ncbi:beta-ketoacyl-[acyl-carrier-protein] synthase family protein [Candidatus Babeliales bacterium]|nr:beta-ketoacyl-[acyl-carrier-protein] synthase family protein [Candidatus Babeliales bacterium]
MAHKHEVVITGIGLVTPVGNDTATTWHALSNGISGITAYDLALPSTLRDVCLRKASSSSSGKAGKGFSAESGKESGGTDCGVQEKISSVLPEEPEGRLEGSKDEGSYESNVVGMPVGLVKNIQQQLNALLPAKLQSRSERFTHLALLASSQALADAGCDNNTPHDRETFGVYVGVGIGGLSTVQEAALGYAARGANGVSPLVIPKAINNIAASWVAMQHNLQGPVLGLTSACSSGADALGHAFRAVRDGYATIMLAGGAEGCATPFAMTAFDNMRALSRWQGKPEEASRPFDVQRAGFVIAEGAGMLVLERKDHALARGAHIYAQIVGYGANADAYHLTAMHPEGRGAVQAIRQALRDAGITPDQIDYINAHGTGTQMNDVVETLALKEVFGAHVDPQTPGHALVSSTKSMTGHMIAAAGGVEAGICALALEHQLIPPTINLDQPDPACTLDYVPGKAREARVRYALSNSFGFGGGNAVLVFKK